MVELPAESREEQQERPLDELVFHRKEKLERLRQKGVNPYPYKFERTHFSEEVKANFSLLEEKEVKVSGRIRSFRAHGKSTFFHIQDDAGQIQIYAKADLLGEQYGFLDDLDIGDFVGINGAVFKTHKGEISVRAAGLEVLAKSLHPLPEKWHGLKDVDLRQRQRYVDLIVTPGVKEVFIQRTAIYKAIREFLDGRGFLEVETPILQPLYGGATARPFKTFHNTLGIPLYLRIADELYLKRLIVGGFEKVYEFCKDFRNEGMDRFHNPEFSMLELYWAYHDYRDIMMLVKELFVFVGEKILGTLEVPHQGDVISLAGEWKEISLLDSIKEATGIDCLDLDEKTLASAARKMGLEIPANPTWGVLVDILFSEKVQPALQAPTFVIDYPVEISPLAKKHRSNPRLTERFELFVMGVEMANAFSELNDPIDQRKRFEQQLTLKEKGDEEAHVLDEDFLRALEYGMPPTGGLGIGLDRWVMFLTDQPSIRDVIFFPQMRPEGS